MSFTKEEMDGLAALAKRVEAENREREAVERARQEAWQAMATKLAAPQTFRDLQAAAERLQRRVTSKRPSHATSAYMHAQGEVAGFVRGLALGLGLSKFEVTDLWIWLRDQD